MNQNHNHNHISPSLHPQFRAKTVCRLTCKSCLTDVCMRGMKAILLADSRVELYSTDRPPKRVQLVYDDYRTRNCKCRIRDVACLGCGNTLGYHVTQPCQSCLKACNNGHFWMFHADGVSCTERYVPKSSSSSSSSSSSAFSLSSSSSSLSSPLSSSRSNEHRRGRRRGRNSNHSPGDASRISQLVRYTQVPNLSFRQQASIHAIENNNAVNNTGSSSSSSSSSSSIRSRSRLMDSVMNDEDSIEGVEGEIDEEEDEDEEEEDKEEEEEKPQVMLWAALHAQEERYLQQMQQQFMIQQQQQQGEQQQNQQPLSPVASISLPTVGSRYHSLISTAISNASMTLWDEGRSINQYEQLCR
ncbi:Protein fam72a [Modicella reniformis]|uniref:Protein fam72a n=1 Tax=Modicella reniformis TaxID=1440133 RepID=A0A9P6MBN6_9FUNG|nr:Protein fam72a [Modicella reniformis]